ncbi:MAG: response regulator [Polyangiales bacterium]
MTLRSPTTAHVAELPGATRPIRVLVAEDDHEMRRLLVSTLRRAQCEVIEARTGVQLSEQIAIAHQHTPPNVDLIISDVRMPGRSGLDVLGALRHTDRATPVILITGFGDSDIHARAHSLGALAVFNKPFDLDDLHTLVVSLRQS